MKSLKPSYKDILSPKALTTLIATAYLLIMFVIYPLYMDNGYVGIDESKFKFYLYTSIGGVLLLLLTGAILLIKSFKNFNKTDGFVLLFLTFTVISFFISDYREEALLGTQGWFMGLVTILIYLFLYILISRLWDFSEFVIYAALIAAFIVYVLAILDRFSLYIIPLEVRAPSFISTIGNINWLMGYYSVLTPVGVSLFLCELKENGWRIKSYLLLVFSIVSFMAGFAQGSESVFLFDIALFIGLIVMAYKNVIRLKDVALIMILWSFGAQIVRFLRYILDGYNYDSDGLCGVMTSTNITLYILILSVFLYWILNKNEEYKKMTVVYKGIFISIFSLLIFWIVIGILNTKGILNIDNGLLKFNEAFGHGRGEAYKISIKGFGRMPVKNMIFGVGPDCLSAYLYNIRDIADEIVSYWPGDRLSNAHSEPLTVLVNGGILGVITYFGIFASFIFDTLKKHKSNMIWCITLAAFTYIVHNLISFSQILNTPFIFILLGMGMSLKMSQE